MKRFDCIGRSNIDVRIASFCCFLCRAAAVASSRRPASSFSPLDCILQLCFSRFIVSVCKNDRLSAPVRFEVHSDVRTLFLHLLHKYSFHRLNCVLIHAYSVRNFAVQAWNSGKTKDGTQPRAAASRRGRRRAQERQMISSLQSSLAKRACATCRDWYVSHSHQ